METMFTPQDGVALYGLLADNPAEIIIRTDRAGRILRASPAIALAGLPRMEDLFGRHIAEIARCGHTATIRHRHALAAAGGFDDTWGEFATEIAGVDRWFAIRMRCVMDEHGAIGGVLSVVRSIDERKSFERQLFVATMTDRLTGLANRSSFTAMLAQMLHQGTTGCLAIFDLDHFKAINLRHGQFAGDKLLIAFANFLRASVREKDVISRICGESIGVLLPGVTADQAEDIGRRIVASMGEIGREVTEVSGGSGSTGAFPVTASAGVATIAVSVDDTMGRAELALALAKAKGRNRLEMEGVRRLP